MILAGLAVFLLSCPSSFPASIIATQRLRGSENGKTLFCVTATETARETENGEKQRLCFVVLCLSLPF